MNQSFSIQFVSQITGINSHTLRAWEKRYNAVTPARDQNKRRLYTQADIDRLKKIHDLCSLGNNVSDIAVLDDANLSTLHKQYFKEVNNLDLKDEHIEPLDINQTLQNLIMALSHYKLDIISHELEKAQRSLTPREFTLNLILPLLSEVGLQVAGGHISVGMEHAISSIIKFNLGLVLFKKYQTKNFNKTSIVICTPDKEFREIPALITTILCASYNYKFMYLGTNMSAFSLKDAVEQIKPNILLLSITKSYSINHRNTFKLFLNTLLQGELKNEIWIQGAQTKLVDSNKVTSIASLQFLDHHLNKLAGSIS